MNLESIQCIYFSPTGTTKKLVESIAKGVSANQVELIDITKRSTREQGIKITDNLVILAVPVYYGRVPEEVVSYLSSLKAQQTPVVPVVVYGNREYEDALLELCDIAVRSDFVLLAGGVFVAEHSYSPLYPIAKNRPDVTDLLKAKEFGLEIRRKFESLSSVDKADGIQVPGKKPYVEPVSLNMLQEARKVVPLTPETDESICTQCGQCVELCPTAAISEDLSQTDRWQCLICFACVKKCPEQARKMTDPNFVQAIKGLYEMTQERKEPEFYF